MIESLQARTKELERTQDVTIHSLAGLAETRDSETGAHIARTQRYVCVLATALQEEWRLDDGFIALLYKSAPLHDIGKVGVPDAVLLKPGPLDEDEWVEMRRHTEYGARALAQAEAQLGSTSFLTLAREIAESHHERWDGGGYPAGLSGEKIPRGGRIMALADVYDALISKRVYKEAFSHEKARDIILSEGGAHFDPAVVDAFARREEQFRRIAEEGALEPLGHPEELRDSAV
jgi:response regulator RpfG family c-di-GMP phosphodiesterase